MMFDWNEEIRKNEPPSLGGKKIEMPEEANPSAEQLVDCLPMYAVALRTMAEDLEKIAAHLEKKKR